MKTNAVRALDKLQISYVLLPYEVDPNDLVATRAAAKVGLPPEQVFKTLVAKGDRHGVCLAVLPSNAELDLKALARITGDRRVDTVPLKQVQPLTGYIRGGVTALACKKPYPVYLDDTATGLEQMAVSAGARGLLMQLAVADYIRAVGATVGAIAKQNQLA